MFTRREGCGERPETGEFFFLLFSNKLKEYTTKKANISLKTVSIHQRHYLHDIAIDVLKYAVESATHKFVQ